MMMVTPVQKQQDAFFENLLESIKPLDDDFIKRRIHHINFARIICWICIESKKRNLFYPDELRKFMRFEASSIHRVLKGLTEAGVLNKKYNPSSRTSYTFVRDTSQLPIIREYFEEALKTLGKKPKRKLTFSVEQELAEDEYF